MAGQSTTGDVVKTGRMMVAQANANTRSGPGIKNLGPSASKQANPKSTVRSIAGRNIKGPDLGGGGG